jgi:hypothetical protein
MTHLEYIRKLKLEGKWQSAVDVHHGTAHLEVVASIVVMTLRFMERKRRIDIQHNKPLVVKHTKGYPSRGSLFAL